MRNTQSRKFTYGTSNLLSNNLEYSPTVIYFMIIFAALFIITLILSSILKKWAFAISQLSTQANLNFRNLAENPCIYFKFSKWRYHQIENEGIDK